MLIARLGSFPVLGFELDWVGTFVLVGAVSRYSFHYVVVLAPHYQNVLATDYCWPRTSENFMYEFQMSTMIANLFNARSAAYSLQKNKMGNKEYLCFCERKLGTCQNVDSSLVGQQIFALEKSISGCSDINFFSISFFFRSSDVGSPMAFAR